MWRRWGRRRAGQLVGARAQRGARKARARDERDARRQEEARRSRGRGPRGGPVQGGVWYSWACHFCRRSGWAVRGRVFRGWSLTSLRRERHDAVDRHADGQVVEGPREVLGVVELRRPMSLAAGRVEEEAVTRRIGFDGLDVHDRCVGAGADLFGPEGAGVVLALLAGSRSNVGLPSLGVTVRATAPVWAVTTAFDHAGRPPTRKSVSSDVEGTRPSRVGLLSDFS